ncbi:MAG TPA: RNase adapter RapZ [Lachnospiraceae bacterium]|nr:RNase adapter RapZ [Lachnospiraceae bacterium]
MKMVIVTGMSGAGKSTTLKMLEDFGYYCVDNLPVPLIPMLSEFSSAPSSELEKVAIGVDVRTSVRSFQKNQTEKRETSGAEDEEASEELSEVLKRMKDVGIDYSVIFLEAGDDILIKRYKETRRVHPLAGSDRVDVGIERERKKLSSIKKSADYIIDTSSLLTRELRSELERIFVENKTYRNLFVTIVSFGFKYGIPQDADLVFDVRFLPNPYYFEDMRNKTGNDAGVRDYVLSFKEAEIFLDKLDDMISFLLPNYIAEGKTRLIVAIGCTGGKHRSVTLANAFYERVKNTEAYGFRIEHRDILR